MASPRHRPITSGSSTPVQLRSNSAIDLQAAQRARARAQYAAAARLKVGSGASLRECFLSCKSDRFLHVTNFPFATFMPSLIIQEMNLQVRLSLASSDLKYHKSYKKSSSISTQ